MTNTTNLNPDGTCTLPDDNWFANPSEAEVKWEEFKALEAETSTDYAVAYSNFAACAAAANEASKAYRASVGVHNAEEAAFLDARRALRAAEARFDAAEAALR